VGNRSPLTLDKYGAKHLDLKAYELCVMREPIGQDLEKGVYNDGKVASIELQVTEFAADDPEGRDAVRDAFSNMVAALSSIFGEPSARKPGSSPEVRWTGPVNTLRLIDLAITVQMELSTNISLAEHDEIIELEEQGLL
jgi:hypothetical protein